MAELPTKQKLWGGRFTGKTDPLCLPLAPRALGAQ
jgi:hypothetical protein